MKPERWERIKLLFDSALEKDPGGRAEFLREACGGDESLRSEVESMLARHSESPDFLKSPALEAEAKALAKELNTRMVGSTLGHYRVDKQLGQGGMGEVYLADDISLNRKVALKFLPDIFSGDPERMARFEREAKLLASLNHPNIAAIHGLEQAQGKRFLILELVEGETLAHRLRKGRLPLEEALGICRQIAEALEAAHEKGIIHRDLKPANVMITEGHKVKLLDFGLAKALSSETQRTDSSQSPTITEVMTQPGIVLGTAAYMSPEQAKGKPVDKRADIWTLGCILYECLAGQPAFEGETVTETLAVILKGEPNWQALPASTHPSLRFVLRRCLEKDVNRRFHDAADVQIQMEEADCTGKITEIAAAPKRLPLGWGAAAVLFATLATIAFIHFREKPAASAKPAQLQIALPEEVKHVDYGGFFAISPDGSRLAFEAAGSDGITRIWVRTLDSLEARPLPGTENSQWCVFWSPDSSFIAFSAGGKLKKINVSGGPPQEICNLDSPIHGGAWNRDGVIILGQSGGTGELMRVSSGGGALSRLTELNRERKEMWHMHPTFLPDGRHFLYFCTSAAPNSQGIYLGELGASAKDQMSKLILTSNHQPVYVPSQDSGNGTLLFQRQDALMAQAFDEKQMELVGEPLPVAAKVGSVGVYGLFSASNNSVLVYRTIAESNLQPTWFDRQGKIIGTVGEPGFYFRLALSLNGERVAVGNRTPPAMLADVWLLDLFRGTNTRLTFGKGDSMRPVWSPDGNYIAYSGTREGGAPGSLYRKLASGAEKEELLFKSSESKFVTSWSSDGRYLLYTASNQKTKNDLWMLMLGNNAQAHPLLHSEFNEDDGQFSPDMRWIAYVSDESGRDEIYVREFCEGSGDASQEAAGEWQQASQGGGKGPRWRGDGKELYYQAQDEAVMAVGITTDKRFRTGLPKVLFKAPPSDAITRLSSSATPVWDVAKSGNRFLLAIPTREESSPFTVILNWPALLKK